MGKNEIVLIDTSSWVEALRSTGKEEVRERVLNLMADGRAAWCDMVVLELWNGARGDYERSRLSELEKEITGLPATQKEWRMARDLAQKCRLAGQTIPPTDLIIAACALTRKAGIEHCDSHMDFILTVHGAA